jgi:hypothetical protein
LDFGSNDETKNEPLLIIRSNTAPTNSQSANTSATYNHALALSGSATSA